MSTTDTARRTKRRFAHELYPHAAEYVIRPLAVEVPYLYARMAGLDISGTSWSKAEPRSAGGDRTMLYLDAVQTALLADALHQGMAGDAAWRWANERIGDGNECAYERADLYGVPLDDIKPYPCGPEPDPHRHLSAPDVREWRVVTMAPGTCLLYTSDAADE